MQVKPYHRFTRVDILWLAGLLCIKRHWKRNKTASYSFEYCFTSCFQQRFKQRYLLYFGLSTATSPSGRSPSGPLHFNSSPACHLFRCLTVTVLCSSASLLAKSQLMSVNVYGCLNFLFWKLCFSQWKCLREAYHRFVACLEHTWLLNYVNATSVTTDQSRLYAKW